MTKQDSIDIVLEDLGNLKELFYLNKKDNEEGKDSCFTVKSIIDAEARLLRFAPLLAAVFKELEQTSGIIESELTEIENFKNYINNFEDTGIDKFYMKMDCDLPVSGSVKARGGIYAVLCVAEEIAVKEGIIETAAEDYRVLLADKALNIFKKYKLSVGSTGNLGLSIGIAGKHLGFDVEVHMSSDAKEWKKEKLRSLGVKVIEYDDDYIYACSVARKNAEGDKFNYFIDDENSADLFLGYSVAALRLKKQIDKLGIKISKKHPLFVYLPCGVGGAPGGITFGLKQFYGDDVYCFFAEPVQAPCFVLGMATGKHSDISVYDIGLTGQTDADGLAVGKSSELVGKIMEGMLDGCYTVSDENMYRFLYKVKKLEDIKIEPSAAAGLFGPVMIERFGGDKMKKVSRDAVHIAWATGGSMVPEIEYDTWLEKGKSF